MLLFALAVVLAKKATCSEYPNVTSGKTSAISFFRVKLAMDSVNTENIVIRFVSGATAKYTADDAAYLQGFGEVSLSSLSSDSVRLAINVLPFPKRSETIRLVANVEKSGSYKLFLQDIVNVPNLFDVWLMDAFKKDSVDLRHTKAYNFTIDINNPETFGAGRFSLVIRQNSSYAFKLLNFGATKVIDSTKSDKVVQLDWETENEQSYTHFSVERSVDNGKTFDDLGDLLSSGLRNYSLLDKSPQNGTNIYRLKSTDISDSVSYSAPVALSYADQTVRAAKVNLNVYPNPVKNTLSLKLQGPGNGAALYNISITNSSGLLVKQATSPEPSWQGSVADLMPGIYMITVSDNKNKMPVGYTKFLKI